MKKKKEDMYDNDFDRWGTTPGATYSLDDIDEIEEVDKGIDHIEEIEKFNPFHDAAGKFSSSSGFKTYSANPNTKAGAMAIARSTAAGHGNTLNVHRESYGENLKQNANWIGQGKQVNPRWRPSTTLTSRVEPAAGLAGASATGASWQHQNQMQGRKTGPSKNPQKQNQQNQQPKQTTQQQNQQQNQIQQQTQQTTQTTSGQGLQAATANVTLRASHKLAIQPRDAMQHSAINTTSVAKDHDQAHVQGKDISKNFDYRNISGTGQAVDKVAKAQGWNKASTATNDLETFQKAAAQSGIVLIRTVHPQGTMSSDNVLKSLITDGSAPMNGSGGQAYGGGIYTVGAKISGMSGKPMEQRVASAQKESSYYGDTQIMATVHPSAKIATPAQSGKLLAQFQRLPASERRKFGNDEGAYIASKGYDGAQWHSDNSDPYITMYNKSSMIYYAGASDV